MEARLALPSSGPPSYSAINQPSIHVIPQDRPRNAYRHRFWNFFACAVFLLLYTLHALSKKQFNWTPVSLSTSTKGRRSTLMHFAL